MGSIIQPETGEGEGGRNSDGSKSTSECSLAMLQRLFFRLRF
jgi:hypothetical protein